MKKQSRRKVEKGPTKKQIARSVREKEQQRKVMIGLAIAALLILAVIVYALVNEKYLKPHKPVAEVNGEKITLSEYQKMVLYNYQVTKENLDQYLQVRQKYDPKGESQLFQAQILQLSQLLQDPKQLGQQTLDKMIEDVLIEQAARENGITVTSDEVQRALEKAFGYDRDATSSPITSTKTITGTAGATPTPPMTKEKFEELYKKRLETFAKTSGITDKDIRKMVRIQLLREKLQKKIGEEKVPPTAEEVHARHILIAFGPKSSGTVTETVTPAMALTKAISITMQLKKGADFAELAKKYSDDPGSKDKGGDLGWFPRGVMVKEFEDAAFSLKPGQISDPVKTQYGYHIIQVLAKDPHHPLDKAILQQKRQEAFQKWFEEYKKKAKIKKFWTPAMLPPLPTPTP